MLDISPSSPLPIDEFLNLDSQETIDFPNFTRNNSSSPASSVNPLPPTPSVGQTAMDTIDFTDNDVFQDLYRTFILPKASTSTQPLPETSFPFNDLFAGYPPMDSIFAQPQYPLAIDPQLMATPALQSIHDPLPVPLPPPALPPTTSAPTPAATTLSQSTPSLKDLESDSEDDSEEEEEPRPKPKVTIKAGKKASAVATGGIVKRTGPTSCVVRDPESNDPEDWRPTAEEYKKLSSKEKRQLRNKISARNFRVRRKEYITTLEGHIADRDRLIEAIREELGQSKLENSELRQEVDALKKAMLEGKAHPTGLPPPAPISDDVASATPAPLASSSKARTPLPKPNVNKDVSGSAAGSKAFWGGASLGHSGITPVHATLIPDNLFPSATASVLSGKAFGSRLGGPMQDNINPLMNLLPPSPPASPPTNPAINGNPTNTHNALDTLLRNAAASHWSPSHSPQSLFDGFSDNNPFTIKSLDGYRMQLWGKIAAAHHAQQQHLHQQPSPPSSISSGSASSSPSPPNMFLPLPLFNQNNLSGSIRPAFFTSHSKTQPPPSPSLSAVLAGKASTSSPTPGPSSPTQQQREAQATAYVAAMASQSLVSRMGSAFWDAFSGSSSGSSGSKAWDADKVRKVLEGKAVVRVVDVDEHKETKPKVSKFVSTTSSPRLAPTSTPKLGPSRLGTLDSLEESMKKMSLKEDCCSSFTLEAEKKCAAACAGVFSNLRGGTPAPTPAPTATEAK